MEKLLEVSIEKEKCINTEVVSVNDFSKMVSKKKMKWLHSQLPSCSGLESSGPSQLRASFLTVAHLLLRNVPSALALKFLLTDSLLAVIRFCRGLTHFGSVEVSLNPEMDFNGPSELRKISKE
ncbi:unnamed protein product [Danaus chrysippus]|uniref:(African queen) hypothetical protein n=1 Tax=Danaus chrysippus TaxID=151541 RepID=A0A8J2QJ93_9NEOP|nr:unnamed protein product [Danaus chrysippus]